MTIVQKPSSINLSGNLPEFILFSDNPLNFVLKIGNNDLFSGTYTPGNDRKITINVKEVIESVLSFQFRNILETYTQDTLVGNFTAYINDEIIADFRVIKGGISNFGMTAETFLQQHFLTWQPRKKKVSYSSPEYLSYYAITDCRVKLKAYISNTSSDSVETIELVLSELKAGNVYTIPMMYAYISGKLNKYPSSYDVWIENTDGSVRYSYIQRYEYEQTKSEQEEFIIFENSLGGVDCFRAYGNTVFNAENTHNIATINEQLNEYRIDTEYKYTKNTGYLNQYEQKWLKDFFPSTGKYIFKDNILRKIVITEDNVSSSAQDAVGSYEFTYRYADDNIYLNLPIYQNSNTLISPMSIQSDNIDVIPELEPRMAEFPMQELSDGSLFPVQEPFSERWHATNAGAIANYIIEKINQLTDGHLLDNRFKGYFLTETSLKTTYPNPLYGESAWVGVPFPGVVYTVENGQWKTSGKAPEFGDISLEDYATKEELSETNNYTKKITTEYNVSTFHPTSGISGGNKYDLANAIGQVPAELRTAGLTVSFLNESGDTEKWEFSGGSWAVGGFSQVGAEKLTELSKNIFGIPIFSKGGIDAKTGNSVVNEGRVRTDDFYIVDYNLSSDTGIISYLYDENKAYLGYVALNNKQTSETALKSYPTAKFAKFSVDGTNYNMSGYAVTLEGISQIKDIINKLDDKISIDIKDHYNSLLFVGNKNILPYFVKGEINASTGNNVENEERLYTPDYYEVDYNLTYSNGFSLIAYLYDENKNYLGYVAANNKQTSETAISQFVDAKLARFSILSTDISPLSGYAKYIFVPLKELQYVINQIDSIKGNNKTLPSFVVGEINSSSGNNVQNESRLRTDNFYDLDFNLSGVSIIVYAYDEDNKYLGFISANTTQTGISVKNKYPTAKKVRFSIIGTSYEDLIGYAYYYIYTINELSKKVDSIKGNNGYNILEGLIWAYCGDSFSYGGYSSSEITDNDKMPQDSMYAGKNKVYGYIIADRNNMILQNMSMGGRTLATPADGSFTNAFTNINNPASNSNYKQIREDANFATFYFGINDSHHRPGSGGGDGEDNTGEIEVGTIDDETENTFYGAWNVMLKWVIENRPFTKLGIIVSNGCETDEYRIATIEIAKKWGVPYIDLNGDERTPMMLRSTNPNISSVAKNARLNSQRISSTNSHPNTKAHEYESTFIEDFLRSL